MNNKNSKTAAIFLFVLAVALFGASLSESYSIGPNYRNVSIDVTVNVTNSKPEILSVIIEDGSGSITLDAGINKTILCNASILDYNGGNTIANVTATFYDNTSATHGSPDDGNNHYSNTSCAEISTSGYYANYTCSFDITYFSNASIEWICNVTATDTYDFNGTDFADLYNTTTIEELYALNVTPLIDYGDLAVEDTSSPQEANITNLGNVPINVSLYGYGSTVGDGLAMVCDVGNISISNQKYSLNALDDFTTQYIALTSSATQFTGLTVPQQFNDVQQVINQTYWRLYVEPNPFGVCNGTVVFQAESST